MGREASRACSQLWLGLERTSLPFYWQDRLRSQHPEGSFLGVQVTSWVTRRLLTSPRSHNLCPHVPSLPAKDVVVSPAAFRPSVLGTHDSPSGPSWPRFPLAGPRPPCTAHLDNLSTLNDALSHTGPLYLLASHTAVTHLLYPADGRTLSGRTVVTRAAWGSQAGAQSHECMPVWACHKCLHSCPGSHVHECVGEWAMWHACHVHEFHLLLCV